MVEDVASKVGCVFFFYSVSFKSPHERVGCLRIVYGREITEMMVCNGGAQLTIRNGAKSAAMLLVLLHRRGRLDGLN